MVILSSGILFFTDDCKIRDPPRGDFPTLMNGSHIFLACDTWMLYGCLCLWRGKIGVIYYAYIEKLPGVEVIKR